jgi:hypothetical protein
MVQEKEGSKVNTSRSICELLLYELCDEQSEAPSILRYNNNQKEHKWAKFKKFEWNLVKIVFTGELSSLHIRLT